MVGEVRTQLSEFGGNFTIIAFSALRKVGVDEARSVLRNWFELFHTEDHTDNEERYFIYRISSIWCW